MKTSKLQVWVSRVAFVGLGLAAMTVGLALGSSGCEQCHCGEPEPFQPGLFEIIGSPARPELVGGMVDATDQGVEISFTDADGNPVVVDYSIASMW
jgi:hypothetical protein